MSGVRSELGIAGGSADIEPATLNRTESPMFGFPPRQLQDVGFRL